jgi:DNA-directed RNA polymerase alpha subunit
MLRTLPIDIQHALTAAVDTRSKEFGFTVTKAQIVEAALRQYLAPELEDLETKANEAAEARQAEKVAYGHGILNSRIDEVFDTSVRLGNCLRNHNIILVRDVVVLSEARLLKMRDFGRKSLNELKEYLEDSGLSLGMNLEDPFVERRIV